MREKRTTILVNMLRPIARICIRFRIPIQEAFDALKVGFVEEASAALNNQGEKNTLSRLSIITGLDRPTVRKIFHRQSFSETEMPVSSKVIGLWQNDAGFRGKGGAAKPLTTGSDESEFAQLVRQVTKNYSPGTMLQELVTLGVVRLEGNRAVLEADRLDYHKDDERALHLYARNAESLSFAFEENLGRSLKEDKNVHLRTEYDNIYLDKIPEVRRWILTEAAKFHRKIREFLTRHDADLSVRKGKKAGGRVVVGSFSVTSPDANTGEGT